MDETEPESVTTASSIDPSTCPRCEADMSSHEFYGVCNDCAANLRETFNGSPRGDVSATEYEPKMNVTPNAVASKE